jgi:DNA-binding CsgD family transcriptional regulator/tetratricopeptide (TPR) repeat protein
MDVMAAVRPTTPFVGRDRELHRLRELIDSAVAGQAAGALLAGDAGVGKTSVVGELSRRATDSGMLVLLGRCVDLGTGGLPYLPFAEAFGQLVRVGDVAGGAEAAGADVLREFVAERPGLARLAGRGEDVPDRAPGDAGLDRLALFDAVASVLQRLAADVAPVLLVVEDLHWADASTRDLVRFLMARLGGERLLVVATYRTDDLHRRHPLRPLLAELVRLPSVERIEISPFAAGEMSDFLTAVHGSSVPPDVVRDITVRSAGNAYFAEELLASGSPDGTLPTALADVLLDSLERLPPETQQLVRVASVLGNCRIDDALLRDVAAETAAMPPAETHAALRDAVAHHALVPDGADRYAFRHALLQEAVYGDLLPGERARMHATAARLLARDPAASAAEQARHSFAAHDLPQALAASLRAAVDARRRLAPAEALEHYEQALQVWDAVRPEDRPADRTVVDVELAAAGSAADSGAYDRAVALARDALAEALRLGDPELSARVRSRLAVHLYETDHVEQAREEARRAVRELPPGPSAARVWAWAIEARVDMSMSEAELADEIIGPALAEARQLGLLTAEADLLVTLSSVDATLGRPSEIANLDAARTTAERAGDYAIVVRAIWNTAVNRYDDGDRAGAVRAIREAIEVSERAGLGSSLYVTQCRQLNVTACWTAGDVEGALAVVEEARRTQPPVQARLVALGALPVHAARDPRKALDEAAALTPDDLPFNAVHRLTATAEALSWLERDAEAVAAATAALDTLDALGDPYQLLGISVSSVALSALAGQAERARARGDVPLADAAVGAGERFLADGRERGAKGRPRQSTMGPEGLAWLARLEAESARLADGGTAALWRVTAEAFTDVHVHEVARARFRLAECLLRDGDRHTARAEIVAAHGTALALGARPLADALEGLARRSRIELAGALPAARGPGAAAAVLTPRERDVMRLVAAGLTNRQIGERLYISEKTASVHVSNVLAKLDASGRAEAVAVATRRGLLDTDPA